MDVESGGITPSERFLTKLSRKTFLKLWSYPNLYNKNRKELCDLLVVCGDVAVIFSDKYINFGSLFEIENSWIRWCKKAVFKSADQIFGAERYIKNSHKEIYTDRQCRNKLPLEFDVDALKVYRVVVANGAKESIERYFKGGARGSLCVDSRVVGKVDHLHRTAMNFKVFTIGDIDPGKGFVHVFNEDNLELIISELDTIADFVSYLDAKEKWFRTKNVTVFAAGEEELLAHYYRCIMAGDDCFNLSQDIDSIDHCIFDEGLWKELQGDLRYLSFKKFLSLSCEWDKIIEMFSTCIQLGEAYCYDRKFDFSEHETAVRFLAKESRINRVMLTKALKEALQLAPCNGWFSRTVFTRNKFVGSNTPYIFVIYPERPISLEDRRRERLNSLFAYCVVFLALHSECKVVVGVALDHVFMDMQSEDILVLQNDNRFDLVKDAIKYQIIFDIYKDQCLTYESVVKEFPMFTQNEFFQIIQEARSMKREFEYHA